jgi:CHAD domain-containing protein
MPARLPSDLLDRSAQESARLLALSYLDQIDSAEQRLADAQDLEALHDFRVGLRRLRSSLAAYREALRDSIAGKMRRRIRDLARATNAGRDAEVQLVWLGKQEADLRPEDKPGYFWLLGRLQGRKQETYDPAMAKVARRYLKLAEKLRTALGILRIELGNGRSQRTATFRELTGALIRLQVGRVQQELAGVRDAADFAQVHQTRIALKRLRYLIEPIARRNRRARALIGRFKEAQDLLGEHHDLHVLAEEIGSVRASLAETDVPRLEPGLAALTRLAQEGAAAAFVRFQATWGGGLAGRILIRAAELGRALEEQAPRQAQVSDLPQQSASVDFTVAERKPRLVTEPGLQSASH